MTVSSTHKEHEQTNQISFSNDGSLLFVTMTNKSVKILSYPSFELLHTLRGHAAACLSVAMSPSGQQLAVGGGDSLITLWDTKEWICERTLDKMDGAVRNLSFSFDGLYVVGGTDEAPNLEVANTETGEYIPSIRTTKPAACVSWHPSRYWLAYNDDRGLTIIGADSGLV
jgi:THO complex subunit 3